MLKKMLCISTLVSMAQVSYAEPTSGPVTINYVRPYSGEVPSAYIEVSANALCDTNTFKINVNDPGGKEMYSAALAAAMAGKKIKLELSNSLGCQGWGSLLQSITVIVK